MTVRHFFDNKNRLKGINSYFFRVKCFKSRQKKLRPKTTAQKIMFFPMSKVSAFFLEGENYFWARTFDEKTGKMGVFLEIHGKTWINHGKSTFLTTKPPNPPFCNSSRSFQCLSSHCKATSERIKRYFHDKPPREP